MNWRRVYVQIKIQTWLRATTYIEHRAVASSGFYSPENFRHRWNLTWVTWQSCRRPWVHGCNTRTSDAVCSGIGGEGVGVVTGIVVFTNVFMVVKMLLNHYFDSHREVAALFIAFRYFQNILRCLYLNYTTSKSTPSSADDAKPSQKKASIND